LTIEEAIKIIDTLKQKKQKALSELETYRHTGKTDIKSSNYFEYSSLVSTLVSGFERQRPMHIEKYKLLINNTGLLSRQKQLERLEGLVNAIKTEIENGLLKDDIPTNVEFYSPAEKNIENIFERFHSCCRQARSRHEKRPTIDVKDEYYAQYLLNILLQLYFSDIRKEEWTPSYAGRSARMDFLLKDIKTVIEVKKTRENLKDKEIGEELILDIAKYSTHPDCSRLYCFVYDPESLIGNPYGLEKDLSGNKDGLNVCVFIRPQ
jgi:hypothetical protein